MTVHVHCTHRYRYGHLKPRTPSTGTPDEMALYTYIANGVTRLNAPVNNKLFGSTFGYYVGTLKFTTEKKILRFVIRNSSLRIAVKITSLSVRELGRIQSRYSKNNSRNDKISFTIHRLFFHKISNFEASSKRFGLKDYIITFFPPRKKDRKRYSKFYKTKTSRLARYLCTRCAIIRHHVYFFKSIFSQCWQTRHCTTREKPLRKSSGVEKVPSFSHSKVIGFEPI